MGYLNSYITLKIKILIIICIVLIIFCSCSTNKVNYYEKIENQSTTYTSKTKVELKINNNTDRIVSGLNINNQYKINPIDKNVSVDVGEMEVGYNVEGSIALNYKDKNNNPQTEVLIGYITDGSNKITVNINGIDENGKYIITSTTE